MDPDASTLLVDAFAAAAKVVNVATFPLDASMPPTNKRRVCVPVRDICLLTLYVPLPASSVKYVTDASPLGNVICNLQNASTSSHVACKHVTRVRRCHSGTPMVTRVHTMSAQQNKARAARTNSKYSAKGGSWTYCTMSPPWRKAFPNESCAVATMVMLSPAVMFPERR
jgi:hypothetical protein